MSQDVTYLAFVPLAEEAARRSPTGSFALRESEASATNVLSVRKRVAWNGNHPFVLSKRDSLIISFSFKQQYTHKYKERT
ncbi:hypothetical protein [Lysinibacillus xylanilyticus]|uniref:hypothetical protein n=1 Tax=Lysinibacillus xylanilyticus TaxID=582475 RepID=UPI003D07F391